MPQPPQPNARRHPRAELQLSVELRHGDMKLVLPARNIGLGGMYLAGGKLDDLHVGDSVEVTVMEPFGDTPIVSTARVVRHEQQGIGLSWSSTDPLLSTRVAAILERLQAG